MRLTLNCFFKTFATVVAAIYAVGAVAALKVADAAQESGGMLMPSAAKEVPAIAFTDAEGNPLTLSDYRGKVVVLHFWAKWCPPCIEELPEMQETLAALNAGEELAVLPLSLDRSPEVVRAFYDEHAITLPLLMDDKGAAMRAVGVKGLPSTLILNRQGKEIARREGVVHWNSEAVKGVLTDALAE